jgi:hypothetical protein
VAGGAAAVRVGDLLFPDHGAAAVRGSFKGGVPPCLCSVGCIPW